MKLGFLTLGLSFVKKHKRLLITGASVVSTTAAVFFALKDGPECARILEELNAQGATTLEKAKAVGPNMLKVAVCWAMSIGLQIFGHKTASDTINDLTASLTNAYLISKLHDDDRQKAIERVVGPEKAKEVEEETKKQKARRSYESDFIKNTVYETGFGEELFNFQTKDISIWFKSDRVDIKEAFLKFSTKVMHGAELYHNKSSSITADLNDLFCYLGLPHIAAASEWVYTSEDIMYHHGSVIEAEFVTDISPTDMVPYTVVSPSASPMKIWEA